jgi:hypothetical protein
MATLAGQMSQTPPGDPQWVAADGKYHHGYANLPNPARPHAGVSTGTRRDYWRNNRARARTRGIGGWLIGAPYDAAATWFISLADDSVETTIPAAPTPANPPAGVK